MSLIIDRFNTIAEVERYSPGQLAGEDDVALLDVQTVQCQLANQPGNTCRGMA